MTTKKFQVIFIIVLGICILVSVTGHTAFKISEFDKASGWVFKYFLIPIVIILSVSNYFLYFKFIRPNEMKEYNSITKTRLRSFFRIALMTLGLSAVLYATTLSFILFTNAYFGNDTVIRLEAKVVQYAMSKGKGGKKHIITIQDPRFSDLIKLRVLHSYEIGEAFNEEVKMGRWGLLYSWK